MNIPNMAAGAFVAATLVLGGGAAAPTGTKTATLQNEAPWVIREVCASLVKSGENCRAVIVGKAFDLAADIAVRLKQL